MLAPGLGMSPAETSAVEAQVASGAGRTGGSEGGVHDGGSSAGCNGGRSPLLLLSDPFHAAGVISRSRGFEPVM
jgi:hypothetical protein